MLIIIAGDSFTGKTVSSCTFPKPMLFMDFDGGFRSVLHTKNKKGERIVQDTDGIDVKEFKYTGHIDISLDSARDKGGVPPPQAKEAATIIRRFSDTLKTINQDTKYKTVVIDSLTTLFRILKDAILFANNIPALRRADYGTLERILLDQLIPNFKSLPVDFVILIDHIDMDKDEITGQILEYPIGPSKSMGRNLGKSVDELYRQKIEGEEYVWKTRKSGFFQAGSRLSVPDTVKAHFRELEKWLSVQRTDIAKENLDLLNTSKRILISYKEDTK